MTNLKILGWALKCLSGVSDFNRLWKHRSAMKIKAITSDYIKPLPSDLFWFFQSINPLFRLQAWLAAAVVVSSLGALTVWWVSLFTSYCTSYFPGIRINYHKLFEPARNLHLLSRGIHGAFLGIAHIFLNVSAKFQLYNIFFWVKLWNDCSTIKSTVGTVPYRTYKYLVEIIQLTLNKSEHRVINSS